MAKSKQIKRRFQHGDVGPGVRCKGCEAVIAIADDLDTVPDEFRAVCPKCGHDHEYQKAEVQNFAVHRKQ